MRRRAHATRMREARAAAFVVLAIAALPAMAASAPVVASAALAEPLAPSADAFSASPQPAPRIGIGHYRGLAYDSCAPIQVSLMIQGPIETLADEKLVGSAVPSDGVGTPPGNPAHACGTPASY